MDNIFRVFCVFSDEDVQSNFKKLSERLQNENSSRLDVKKIAIDYFPVNVVSDYYDVVIIDASSKNSDFAIARTLLSFNKRFNHSQIIVVCNLNLRDYPELTKTLKDTRSFSFGTNFETMNRVLGMHYLFEKEQHLL